MEPEPETDERDGLRPLLGGIPIYRPSGLISRTADAHALVRSPDDVASIERFYVRALAKGGWRIVSHERRTTVVAFRARVADLGVTIAIYRYRNATGIAISVYAVPQLYQ